MELGGLGNFNLDDDDDFFGDSSNSGDDFENAENLLGRGSNDDADDFFGQSLGGEDSSNDDLDSGADSIGDDSSTRQELSDQAEDNEDNSEMAERKQFFKRAALMGIGLTVGLFLIVILLSVMKTNSKRKASMPQNNNTQYSQNVQQNNNAQPVQVVSNNSGWKEIDTDTIYQTSNTQANKVEGVFTVTKITSYGRVSDDSTIQLKTELEGSIDGLHGIYVMDLPYEYSSKISLGMKLNIYYSIGKSSNQTIVYNIEVN